MVDYEVIVVGAGPAGLIAGSDLAKAGIKTLILDKKQEIGCPKRCAEGLSMNWFKRLNLEVKPSFCIQPMHGAQLYSPNGKSIMFKKEECQGYVLERKTMEKELAIQAVKNGAKLLMKNQVIGATRLNESEIKLEIRENDEIKYYTCNIVIACDAVDSLTSKMLGLNTKLDLREIDAGYQYEMTGITGYDENLLHLYFGIEVAPRGYIWIFPKRDGTANVGIGIGGYISSETKMNAKQYLDRWIASQPGLKDGSIIEVNAGTIPVGGFLEAMQFDNLLVAGDAGHMVDPVHGGGIGIAMEGGRIAAKHAIKAIKEKKYSKTDLEGYTKEWYETRGNELKKRLTARHLLEELKDDDFNYLAESISMDEALKIGNNSLSGLEKTILFTKKLITRPGLITLLMKYMK
ncbi:MAG: NAD(P)/FAD-dependent oxidoreductase [Candidatus ainarchaeum sp.]|nr:NAD(P)/FAD-dependent oxidoreductase [Candidatus ainarchaeum sp.]